MCNEGRGAPVSNKTEREGWTDRVAREPVRLLLTKYDTFYDSVRWLDNFQPIKTVGSVSTEILNSMAEANEVLRMYRRILKLAQRYPSIKRQSIICDIKSEFRANRNLSDAQKVRKELAVVQAGIKELSMYASLHPSLPNWNIEVGHDVAPMPFDVQSGDDVKDIGGGEMKKE
uniref:Complex 1 LYR protein domain-containing protein n=2 Tax=Hyaloperonospora arabidopsidis (strain Emoy2) TaxID=559515 RepID=M4BQ11_HYAAE